MHRPRYCITGRAGTIHEQIHRSKYRHKCKRDSMKPASDKHKRFLYRLGVPVKILNQLSAQAAYVISHDLVDGTATPLGSTENEDGMIGALIDEGFDPEMVYKFSPQTGRTLLDFFSSNVKKCPCCGSMIVG
jgi:hypothetical protein